ncbi:fas-binding factor 1 twitchy isoform X2 [Lycorma delicatula]|uniref:fas-binding factor 1 twitchy isoform X2 n=1 Tax=Lycorma delicatula TaxID=130591 RepID=UPI003F51208C
MSGELSEKGFSNFYRDINEEVSEVDAEDMAKILKGADDIDDELFGFSNQSKQKIKNATTGSFGKEKENYMKTIKKVGFDEFNDSDPLGDISLSDDDFYDVSKDKVTNPPGSVSKQSAVSAKVQSYPNSKKSESSPSGLLDKSTKSKLIKDLFGLDNDNESHETSAAVTAGEKKRGDWLGIRESPKKTDGMFSTELIDDKSKVNEMKLQDTVTKSNNKNVTKNEKLPTDVIGALNDNDDDLIKPAFKQSDHLVNKDDILKKDHPRNSLSFDITNKKEGIHKSEDEFDILRDTNEDKLIGKKSKSNDKVPDINDELFIKGGSKSNVLHNNKVKEKTDITGKNVDLGGDIFSAESPGLGHYLPSSGSARRPGYGRRREGIALSANSPKRSVDYDGKWLSENKVKQSDIGLTSTDNKETAVHPRTQNLDFITNPESHTSETNSLPSWLGGKKYIDDKETNEPTSSVIDSHVESKKQPKIDRKEEHQNISAKDLPTQKVSETCLSNKVVEEDHLIGEVLNASSTLNCQNLLAMQQTENQLLSVMQMKHQQDMISDLCNRQKQLLNVQRQQIEHLVKQQIDKQLKIDEQMKLQQEKINILMQSLMTEIQKPVPEDFVMKESLISGVNLNPAGEAIITVQGGSSYATKDTQNDLVTELEISLQRLKIEKASLEQQLESINLRHSEEIKSMEQFHRNEIKQWEEREEKLKQSQDNLYKDYEAKLKQFQENELQLIEQHNMRIENLQKERLSDLRQMGEFHRLAMEQVASVGKILFEDSRLIESKRAIEAQRPADESELSARELTILKKERELSALRESLENQRMNLLAEKEEMEEKLELEKRQSEEKLKMLKREQSLLKIKEEEFIREQEREKDFLKMQKKQIEELREKVLKEQAKAIEERLQVTASQARLEALAKLQGGENAASISSFDLVQARAEVEGAMNAAKEERFKTEEEKRKLKEQKLLFETERWKLKEWEHEILIKTQHFEDTIKVAEARREEGIKALEEAKLLEKKIEVKAKDVHSQLNDLNGREEKLMKNFVDPKKLIMKLKAEKELESLTAKS